MQSLNKAFSNIYVKEFSSDTFSKNNNKKDKILNAFLQLPNVRISWINELCSKLDDSIFKKFCEGICQTTSLYKDGFNDIEHLSKVILTSNELPNIRIDTGVTSRIVSHSHRSFFTDNDEEIDEEKYIFKKNNNLISEIDNSDNYKNAIVDIILKLSSEYLKSGLPKIPQSMLDDKNEIVGSNDYIQDFIDSKIEFKEGEKVGKQQILEAYQTMYPSHNRTVQQMISSMKDKNIQYKHDMRCNNIKGSFIGIQFKQEKNSNTHNLFRCPNDVKEIENLKKQVAELQALLKVKDDKEVTPKKSKKNMSKKESKIEIEQTNMFSNEDLMDSFNESINDLL